MKIDELNNNYITAEEGKVFRRISDSQLFGNEIYLGYTYYLSGEKLEEHTPLEDTNIEETETIEDEPKTDVEQKKRITVADYHKLEKQVAMLIQMMGGTEWQD